nr:unnamed protein product [Callosobruchus analis]
MQAVDGTPNQAYSWISTNDFTQEYSGKSDPNVATFLISLEGSSAIMDPYCDIKVEQRTDIVSFADLDKPVGSLEKFAETLKTMKTKPSVRPLTRFSQYSPFSSTNLKSASAPPTQFSIIVEGEESEIPSISARSNAKTHKTKQSENSKTKENGFSYKTVKAVNMQGDQATPASPKSSASPAKKSNGMDAKKEKKLKRKIDMEKIRAGLPIRLFLRGFCEMTIVTVVLFVLDVLVNSEQYGYQNYIFST